MTGIPQALQPYQRSTWKPQTKAAAGPRLHSKFAGQPWIPPGEPWPECPHCAEPMQLFLQLNLNQIPESLQAELGNTGLLQLFYCVNDDPHCEVECEAWFPFAQSTMARILHPNSPDADSEEHNVEGSFPEQVIIGWEELIDYPDPEEAELMGVYLSDEDWDALEQLEESGNSIPHGGDKLSGWPFWVQSVEYPDCPVCGDRMRLVFQLDSEDHLPYMFGDAGCGHLTQCERHRDQLAFGWACA